MNLLHLVPWKKLVLCTTSLPCELAGTGIYGPLIGTLPKKTKEPMLTCNHGSKRIKELVKEPTLNRRMFVGTLS